MKYLAILLTAIVGVAAVSSAAPRLLHYQSSYGTVVWQSGNPTLGKWEIANTYQCDTPVNNGATFYFDLKKNGQSCGRNQMNPLASNGSLFRLTVGSVYTWVISYIDGDLNDNAPGMGNDNGEAQSIIWQIHGYNEPDTPLTQLGFANTPPNSGSGQPQEWMMSGCGHGLSNPFWTATYTPQEKDVFVIQVKIANNSSGWIKLYRNNVLVGQCSGPTFHNSSGAPWWNTGPYKWRWELANGGGSEMSEVQASFDYIILYKQ